MKAQNKLLYKDKLSRLIFQKSEIKKLYDDVISNFPKIKWIINFWNTFPIFLNHYFFSEEYAGEFKEIYERNWEEHRRDEEQDFNLDGSEREYEEECYDE